MSLYKSLDKEIAKLEDPNVPFIRVKKEQHRAPASFRSTIYNVASHRGLSITVRNVEPCIFEITRKDKNVSVAFEGKLGGPMVQKNLKLTTNVLNERTIAGAVLLLNEGIVASFEFISYDRHDLAALEPSLAEMGLAEIFSMLHVESTESSIIVRVKTEVDRLAEPNPV